MEYSRFLEHLSTRAGLSERAAAEAAAQAVVRNLAEILTRAEAERLADELPDELAATVRKAEHGHPLELPELVQRIRASTQVRTAVARELLTAAGMTLAEAVPEHVLGAVREGLPKAIGELLCPPPEFEVPVGRLEHRHRTLAEGAAGGTHPLYAARPDRTQSHSVVAENPHGDTKLSSARGLTQEREEEDLASAHGITQERERTTLATGGKGREK